MSRPLVIYTGYAIRYPLGGHVLAELHNIVGLHRLGFDVLYVEESGGNWPTCYNPVRNEMTDDPGYGITTLERELRPFGLDRHWCYVDAQGRSRGRSPVELRAACQRAALLFGHSRVTWLPEFADCRTRVFIDTDPAITQFELASAPRASQSGYVSPADFHFHFTLGECIGRADCPVPTGGLLWRPTRWPLALELMPVAPAAPPEAPFTTVMSWRTRGAMPCGGVAYGDKDWEFPKFLDLPRRAGAAFEIALAGGTEARGQLTAAGWRTRDALAVTGSVAGYRQFIAQSRGEFSVAKNIYVATRSGWFSDRSASYLAAGKPVILQETGFSKFLPVGHGLFAVTDLAEAAAAVATINADYPRHCRAARRIAEEYFAAGKVLGALLRECGVAAPSSGRS